MNVGSNKLTNIDVSKNTALTKLYVDSNKLTNIDVSKNTALIDLFVDVNNLTELDVSNHTALTRLTADLNQLTNLDVSNNTALTSLHASCNKLTNLDVSTNTALTNLDVTKNKLTNLDVSTNAALTKLYVDSNKLTELDVVGATALKYLNAKYNQLTNLDVSNHTALTYLNVHYNKLTNLDVSNNTTLTELYVSYNQLTNLDVSTNTALTYLYVYENQLTNLDVSNNTALEELSVSYNQLTNLDVSKNTALTGLYVYDNQLTNLDVSNNAALTKLYVGNNQLTSLDVSNNTALIELSVAKNNLTELDVSTNTALTYLNVGSNQLTNIDVSNNPKLTGLYINSNPFAKNKAVYKDDTFDNTNSVVKLPEGKTSTMTEIRLNNSVVNKVDTTNQGNYQYDISFRHNVISDDNSYTVKLNLYVIEATSDKYDINAEEGYIYTKTDTDEETILSNISLNYGEASIENNKLLVKYDGELIKSFDIINISSSKYDTSKDYIYLGLNDFSLEDINVTKGQKILEDNKLKIKYNDNVLNEYDLVKISSSKYDLTKEYIFDNDFNVNNITLINGTKELKDNKLLIKYSDEVVESYDIVTLNSETYDLTKEYIFTEEELNLDLINTTNLTKEVVDNKLIIKYNNNLFKEYQVISINFGEYEVYDGLLLLPEDITYEEFTNNITTNGVTYKIFNGESEITEGNISEGMIIKIYYGDKVIDEYEVTNEYLELDESLNIDNEVNIIEKLNRNLKLKGFKSLINTSGSIEVRNNNNELLSDDSNIGTGSKVKITLSNRVVEYTLSVRGDITGNGQAKMADVMKIATHIIEGNVIVGTVFERAADITGDGKIKMNDVMKLATFIIDGGEL